MGVACSICASTKGPFTQEPTGVKTSPYFVKCQTCAQKYTQISFDGTIGRNPAPSLYRKYFHECPNCHSLYYGAIPYAYLHYSVTECPICGEGLPIGSDLEFANAGPETQDALKSGVFRDEHRSLDYLKPLYDKLVARHSSLSKAIDNIMLIETERGNDIWVITKGTDPNLTEALQKVLFNIVDKKLSFSSSQRFSFAKGDIKKILFQDKLTDLA
jgi:hypothetical protein